MRKTSDKYPYVEVKWIDASSREGWEDLSSVRQWGLKDLECKTTGYLLQETKDILVLVQSFSPDQVDNQLCIPQFAIIKVRKLR